MNIPFLKKIENRYLSSCVRGDLWGSTKCGKSNKHTYTHMCRIKFKNTENKFRETLNVKICQ